MIFQGTGRVYQIGFDLVEIPISVIEKLQDWNASPQNDNLDIDRCFTLAVLLTLVEKEDIINGNVSDAVREFIRGKKIHEILETLFQLYFLHSWPWCMQ